MISTSSRSARASLVLLFVASTLFFTSAILLREQADMLALVQEDALPLAGHVAPMEERLKYLTQEADLAERASASRTASLKEQLSAYVLPSEPDSVRTVALLETLLRDLQSSGHVRAMAPVDVGSVGSSTLVPSLQALPLHVSIDVDDEGLRRVLSFLRLTGSLTVSDAIAPSQSHLLLKSLEEGNPADIVALEQFLQADLLAYAAAPDAAEGRLLSGVSAPSFAGTFRSVQKDSLLLEAKDVLGGSLGKTLREAKLWPSPLLLTRATAIRASDEGWHSLSLELESMAQGQ